MPKDIQTRNTKMYKQRLVYKKRYGKVVKPGFRHDWTYRGHWQEKKVRPGLWKFNFRATKHRHARGMGSFGVGTIGAWKIQGIQYIRKTSKGSYQTQLIGTKKPLKFHIKKTRRYY